MSRRYASILPLEYTPTRTEHQLSYFSSDWSDLVPLLTDPNEFMRKRQAEWCKTGVIGEPIEWNVNADAVGRIECGFNTTSSVLKLLSIFPEFTPEDVSTELTSQGTLGDEFLRQTFNKVAEAGGAFYAEFALDTGMLLIEYFPPKPPTSFSYQGGFTTAVLGLVERPLPHGTIHVDLVTDGCPNVAKAQFLVAHMENPEGTCARLNEDPANLIIARPVVMQEGDPLVDPTPGILQRPEDEGYPIRFSVPTSETAPWTTYPKILVNFGCPPGTTTCIPAAVCYDPAKGSFVLGSMTGKCYPIHRRAATSPASASELVTA